MTRNHRKPLTLAGLALGMACLAGCQTVDPPAGLALLKGGKDEKLTGEQTADVQIALGHSLEQQNKLDEAMVAYENAVQHDPHRADAFLRLAILNDRKGRTEEAQEFYKKALAASPGNADIYCDMGYSLYLQHRYADAQMNLKQALVVNPRHLRAHNNLALVLAHSSSRDAALEEFHKGGCSPAEAHCNLAFALTMEKRWDEARAEYEHALDVNPGSEQARNGLKDLNRLAAKANGAKQVPTATASQTLPDRPAARAAALARADATGVPPSLPALEAGDPKSEAQMALAETTPTVGSEETEQAEPATGAIGFSDEGLEADSAEPSAAPAAGAPPWKTARPVARTARE